MINSSTFRELLDICTHTFIHYTVVFLQRTGCVYFHLQGTQRKTETQKDVYATYRYIEGQKLKDQVRESPKARETENIHLNHIIREIKSIPNPNL